MLFEEAYDWDTAAVMIHSMMENGETGLDLVTSQIKNQCLLDFCRNLVSL